jgi:hypothetical protein
VASDFNDNYAYDRLGVDGIYEWIEFVDWRNIGGYDYFRVLPYLSFLESSSLGSLSKRVTSLLGFI